MQKRINATYAAWKAISVGVMLAMASATAMAQEVEVGGTKFGVNTRVAGQTLVLNGAGIRYRAIFKVSAIGLYLTSKANTLESVLALSGPKRIQIVMLRSAGANEIGRMMSDGVEANATRQEFIAALPAILRLGELAAQMRELSAGDVITVDWDPSGGTYIRIGDKASVGPYKDPEVFSGIAKIWLGKIPADVKLKDALLGIKT